jgi:hypothetical protein
MFGLRFGDRVDPDQLPEPLDRGVQLAGAAHARQTTREYRRR